MAVRRGAVRPRRKRARRWWCGPRPAARPAGKNFASRLTEDKGRHRIRVGGRIMAKKSAIPAVSEALKRAILAYPASLSETARRSGVDVAALSRFVRGERGLTIESVDKLAATLKLELRPAGKAQAKTTKRKTAKARR